MHTFFYSVLHFLTDGICAFALYARFAGSEQFALLILWYDFCAFVLQMPAGAFMDYLKAKRPGKAGRLPYLCALSGAVITVAGAFLHPVILGIGNALFHVGGGIGTIEEDRRKKKKGAALGIFVAPGAMGLYLGIFFGKDVRLPGLQLLLALSAVYLLLFLLFGILSGRKDKGLPDACPVTAGKSARSPLPQSSSPAASAAAALCFLVVLLRSYAGFSVSFPWKEGFLLGFLATSAVVLGKMAGGILAARFGTEKVMIGSLCAAALCYLFSASPAAGLAALFCFNMTMPVTLYMIADRFRGLEGFSFGLLTVALFLGALPTFSGRPFFPGHLLGAAVSLLSLILLLAASGLLKKEKAWRS